MKIIKYTFYLTFLVVISACTATIKEEQGNQEPINNPQGNFQIEKKDKPVILFFGNSITAGYGVDPEKAFSSLIQERLDSLDYNYLVINAGLSGETTSSGYSRVSWVLKTVPEIFVLELGGNDGLRGINVSETQKNLKLIIQKVKEINPEVKILLAGMEVPPNMGEDYARPFRKIFPEISTSENVSLIPFILDKVGGIPELNLPEDGIHPTEKGHIIVAETVWKYLKPLLNENDKKGFEKMSSNTLN